MNVFKCDFCEKEIKDDQPLTVGRGYFGGLRVELCNNCGSSIIRLLKKKKTIKEKIKDMLDGQDISKIKKLLEPLATKQDLEQERDFLARMMKNSFDVTPTRNEMAEGFNMMRNEFKSVNEKLDKKLEGVDKRVSHIEESLVIK